MGEEKEVPSRTFMEVKVRDDLKMEVEIDESLFKMVPAFKHPEFFGFVAAAIIQSMIQYQMHRDSVNRGDATMPIIKRFVEEMAKNGIGECYVKTVPIEERKLHS